MRRAACAVAVHGRAPIRHGRAPTVGCASPRLQGRREGAGGLRGHGPPCVAWPAPTVRLGLWVAGWGLVRHGAGGSGACSGAAVACAPGADRRPPKDRPAGPSGRALRRAALAWYGAGGCPTAASSHRCGLCSRADHGDQDRSLRDTSSLALRVRLGCRPAPAFDCPLATQGSHPGSLRAGEEGSAASGRGGPPGRPGRVAWACVDAGLGRCAPPPRRGPPGLHGLEASTPSATTGGVTPAGIEMRRRRTPGGHGAGGLGGAPPRCSACVGGRLPSGIEAPHGTVPGTVRNACPARPPRGRRCRTATRATTPPRPGAAGELGSLTAAVPRCIRPAGGAAECRCREAGAGRGPGPGGPRGRPVGELRGRRPPASRRRPFPRGSAEEGLLRALGRPRPGDRCPAAQRAQRARAGAGMATLANRRRRAAAVPGATPRLPMGRWPVRTRGGVRLAPVAAA